MNRTLNTNAKLSSPHSMASLTLGIQYEVDTDVFPSAAPIQQRMLLLGLLRSPCLCLTPKPLSLPHALHVAAPSPVSAHLIY